MTDLSVDVDFLSGALKAVTGVNIVSQVSVNILTNVWGGVG